MRSPSTKLKGYVIFIFADSHLLLYSSKFAVILINFYGAKSRGKCKILKVTVCLATVYRKSKCDSQKLMSFHFSVCFPLNHYGPIKVLPTLHVFYKKQWLRRSIGRDLDDVWVAEVNME